LRLRRARSDARYASLWVKKSVIWKNPVDYNDKGYKEELAALTL
jgi:hypothetical protein